MILHLNTGNGHILKHAEIMILPLDRFLKSQLSHDVSALASFPCDIVTVTERHIYSISSASAVSSNRLTNLEMYCNNTPHKSVRF